MIKSKRTCVVVAFSALGLAGWQSHEPTAQSDAATSTEATVEPAADAEKLVLLTNDRLVRGSVDVDEEEGLVHVTSTGGAIRASYPQALVERIFSDIRELHRYRQERVPEHDLDEQLRLAQWCLTNGLHQEARHHLNLVLRLAPKHDQAVAMRESMKMEEIRLARRRQMDDSVQQTAAEVVDPRPAALDATVVRGARRRAGVDDLPAIFDLPRAAALKRAQEFAEHVNPVLQTHCARCHNERYDGEFQLLQMKNKSERNPIALRANLDATLQLVDREYPGRSELLTSSVRPHGHGDKTRPIFANSNDRSYRILAEWVNRLRSKPTPQSLAGSSPSHGSSDGGEGFAVDRSRIGRSAVGVDPIQGEGGFTAPPQTVRMIETPSMSFTPDKGWSEDDGSIDAPVPFAVSGVMPRVAAPKREPAPSRASQPIDDEDEDSADDFAPPLPMPDDVEIPRPKAQKPSQPLKLDPALLQRALQQKNGGD